MCGHRPDNWYAIRCLMKIYPFKSFLFILVVGVMFFAYCYRVAERPLEGTNDTQLKDYVTCIWLTFITMTTVGYGDYAPVTKLGRFIGLMASMYGVMVFSLMVITVSGHLEMSISENKSLNIITRLKFQNKMRICAAHVITSGIRFRIWRKRQIDHKKLISQLTRFRRAVN